VAVDGETKIVSFGLVTFFAEQLEVAKAFRRW
jgi:hypothetical protein